MSLPAPECSSFDQVKYLLERLRAQVDKHSEIIERSKEEPANEDDSDFPDPENEKGIWNVNSISVLMWKSWFWPKNQKWNHNDEQFEAKSFDHQDQFRSRAQHWMESILCPSLFTFFPLMLVFVEMCILAGIMDQGSNQKSHTYGDGFYQSPTWRFSGNAYLRAAFVPVLDSNGVQIGMTSTADAFNHSMLRDRPESEATRCLDIDYLMPFNKYKVHALLITALIPPTAPPGLISASRLSALSFQPTALPHQCHSPRPWASTLSPPFLPPPSPARTTPP